MRVLQPPDVSSASASIRLRRPPCAVSRPVSRRPPRVASTRSPLRASISATTPTRPASGGGGGGVVRARPVRLETHVPQRRLRAWAASGLRRGSAGWAGTDDQQVSLRTGILVIAGGGRRPGACVAGGAADGVVVEL